MKESIEYEAMKKFLSSMDEEEFVQNWKKYKDISSFDYKYYDKSHQKEETYER